MSKGCEYCKSRGRKPLFYRRNSWTESTEWEHSIAVKGRTLKVEIWESEYDPYALDFDGDCGVYRDRVDFRKGVRINYCPMCGRKLVDENTERK